MGGGFLGMRWGLNPQWANIGYSDVTRDFLGGGEDSVKRELSHIAAKRAVPLSQNF